MGKKCCIKNCSNTVDKNPNVSFHKFPRKDILKYNKWLQAIPPDLISLPSQHDAYICCMHFSKTVFHPLTPTKRQILKQDAIPSIFYIDSEEKRNNDVVENFAYEAKQTLFQGKINEMAIKRSFVNTSTQVSPKMQRISETNTQLRRKVHILQQRLHRRESTITAMRSLIDTLKAKHNSKLEQI